MRRAQSADLGGRRRHAQHLVRLDHIGVVQFIPPGNVAPGLSIVEGNFGEGVARANAVIAWLAGVVSGVRRAVH